jgi:hypothetical protein
MKRHWGTTGAVIQSLDLVITLDSALAHLAGALGRPGLVALKAVPDWRCCWIARPAGTPACACSGKAGTATGPASLAAWKRS